VHAASSRQSPRLFAKRRGENRSLARMGSGSATGWASRSRAEAGVRVSLFAHVDRDLRRLFHAGGDEASQLRIACGRALRAADGPVSGPLAARIVGAAG